MEFFNTHKRQSHKHVKHYRSYNYHLIGTRSNNATATKTPLKKLIIVLSVLIAIIPTLLLCQMQANPPEVEFLGAERETNFRRCLLTYSIKRESRQFHVVVVQKQAKKCTKRRDAPADLLFYSLNLSFFYVLVAVRVVGS